MFPTINIGNTLKDLETTTESGFSYEASFWSATSLVTGSTIYSYCYNKYLIGGYNVLGTIYGSFSRTYPGLPAHNMILSSMTFQPLDSWDASSSAAPGGDHWEIWFDFLLVKFPALLVPTTGIIPSYLLPVCGTPTYKDWTEITLILKLHHSASSLLIVIVSYLDEASFNESFGFRDISITFYNSSNTTYVGCLVSQAPLPSMSCPCPSADSYEPVLSTGICKPCDPSCATCNGPFSTNCLSCVPQKYLNTSTHQCIDCDTSCATCSGSGPTNCLTCQAGFFLASGYGRCIASCPYPLNQVAGNATMYCSKPCSTGSYVLWDQTCSSSCNLPLQIVTVFPFSICKYICSACDFLYWNGTCAPGCNFPLTSRTQNSRYFCDYPCLSSAQILYWNASCLATCGSPSRLESRIIKELL